MDAASGARGDVAAIADGVSYGKAGRIAAELAVREFLEAHHALSPTGGVQRNAGRALQSINSWLHGMAARDPAMQHAATTLTALVFAGRDAHIVHVGDTRAYLLHDGQLLCLTEDHTLRQPEREHVLIRALGLEPSVRADFRAQPLRAHDRLMLCTDGVHGVLGQEKLRALLLRRHAPEEEAERIVDTALQAGSQDNASCIVIDVLEVPELSAPELREQLSALPILAPPGPGEVIDGFRLLARLSEGRYSRLLQARDEVTGADVVMKFPQQNVAPDSTHHLAFVSEAWVGARLHSPWLGETIEVAPERQTRLYSVMPFYSGETLEARLQRRPAVTYAEGMAFAQKLTKAVAVLHRAGIIHRDIKPDNILLETDGGLRLIDLGVVRLPLLEEFPGSDIPGTPSYMAPELFEGQPGDEASDQFALAVTLY
ncbi:MAG TPA: protein kinase, partial [Steroidobacteraceae bacterium]|nr:protein kinase [Steroidobacteraceae bacterium]